MYDNRRIINANIYVDFASIFFYKNKDILKTLNLYSEKEGYNLAALLVSEQKNYRGIDVTRFGETLNIILDREIFEDGSIVCEFDKTMDILTMFNL